MCCSTLRSLGPVVQQKVGTVGVIYCLGCLRPLQLRPLVDSLGSADSRARAETVVANHTLGDIGSADPWVPGGGTRELQNCVSCTQGPTFTCMHHKSGGRRPPDPPPYSGEGALCSPNHLSEGGGGRGWGGGPPPNYPPACCWVFGGSSSRTASSGEWAPNQGGGEEPSRF